MVPIKGKKLIKIDCSAIFGPKISDNIFVSAACNTFSPHDQSLFAQLMFSSNVNPNFTIDFEMRTVMSRLFKSRCLPMHLDADFIISDAITQIR